MMKYNILFELLLVASFGQGIFGAPNDSTVTCNVHQFHCQSGECIPSSWRCDEDPDCKDGSDESSDCVQETCHPDFFQCTITKACIPQRWVCDGAPDCGTPKQPDLDTSDEDPIRCASNKNDSKLNTTDVPKPTNLTVVCEYPSRMCDNNTKCISVHQLCDEVADCVDGTDEGSRCKRPCDSWGVCPQKCIAVGSRFKCACFKGYFLEEDGFSCKSTSGATPYVIFSDRHELKAVDLHTFNVKSFISSLKDTIALDFYHTKTADIVFWTDVIDDKIYRGTVVGGSLSNIEVVVQTGLSGMEGLAVDWIGENLYWVASNLHEIEVAKLNGNFRRTLVVDAMERPRAVAVDPRDAYLFWTDWDVNAPRIERCSLAGLDREIVVRVDQMTDGGWPNGLTLDYDTRRIYWVDARSDSIHTTKYDGTDHHEIIRDHERSAHPFGITLFENYVYWTDWRTNSVVRANKFTGGNVSVIQRTLTQPFDIQILHPARQPRDAPNPCGDNNGGCSHLCLLHTNHTYKCDCPHVTRLSSNNKTCVVNERVLLIARSNEIRGVDILQPYYHTIPTISVPQVLNPVQLEYLARNNTLYWADLHVSEIKSSGLTSGPTQTLIDTGLKNPSGLAIDWLSNLMFVSSPDGITVSNLKAEYPTTLVEDVNVLSVVANPHEGRLYWIASANQSEYIETSAMDGTDRKVLVTDLKANSNSLCIDLHSKRLYWVSEFAVYFSDLDGGQVTKLNLTSKVGVATVYKDHVYYADDDDHSIHRTDKITGGNDVILRNNTKKVVALRIYDPTEQEGTHPCGNSPCQHLCLPVTATTYTCRCASGYHTNLEDFTKCNAD